MAQTKCCDVYGTTKSVKSYVVTIQEVTPVGNVPIKTWNRDYGPRGLDRLIGFIESGLRKPGEKGDANG